MAASAVHPFEANPDQTIHPVGGGAPARATGLQVIRRNGTFSPFDPAKISTAITKAFVAVEGSGAAASRRIHEAVEALTDHIVEALKRRAADGARAIHIEDIQDQVELALMRAGEHKIARAYVLYREERSQERRKREEAIPAELRPSLHVQLKDGQVAAARRGRPAEHHCDRLLRP